MPRAHRFALPAILAGLLIALAGLWLQRAVLLEAAADQPVQYEVSWNDGAGLVGTEAELTAKAIASALYAGHLGFGMALVIGVSGLLAYMLIQNRSLRRAGQIVAKNASDMSFLARHDALTRLPNRFAFDAAYRAAMAQRGSEARIAILAIDLDGFKTINDMLGHGAGDALLVAVAGVLRKTVLDWDKRNTAARVGGDEFLALLWTAPNGPHPRELAEELLLILQRPLETSYGSMTIGATIGVALSGSNAPAEDELIVNADLALTEAKGRGKQMVLEFHPQMRADLQRRLRIEADLAGAVEDGQIFPHYQPQFDLVSGRAIGVEALARWRHPELGWIAPDEFIPIAESCGDVGGVGRRILETACRDATLLPEHIGLSVNISVTQILKDDIHASVRDVLEITGLDPARLRLEITESAMMTDVNKVLITLNRLQALGVHIALDDFGTGFSALSHLTKFRWDELKIDRSLVASALTDPVNMTIIRSVRILARKIQARVTAEGIETPAQQQMLTTIGCDVGQGFLFSPPVPIEEIPPLLLRSMRAAFARPQSAADRTGDHRIGLR
ncbi:MAG: putative bifunctional diguanylate cyclase/phosphodiesterase [Flavobacteriaceae bacterium]